MHPSAALLTAICKKNSSYYSEESLTQEAKTVVMPLVYTGLILQRRADSSPEPSHTYLGTGLI